MIDKYEVDEQKADKDTVKELAAKVNELIVAANTPSSVTPPRREITAVEYATHLQTFGQRIRSGPFQMLYQADPCPLTKAIDDALTVLQNTVTAYLKARKD